MAAAGDNWSPLASLALVAFGLGVGGLGLGLVLVWHRMNSVFADSQRRLRPQRVLEFRDGWFGRVIRTGDEAAAAQLRLGRFNGFVFALVGAAMLVGGIGPYSSTGLPTASARSDRSTPTAELSAGKPFRYRGRRRCPTAPTRDRFNLDLTDSSH
jgi:hypothetical protein